MNTRCLSTARVVCDSPQQTRAPARFQLMLSACLKQAGEKKAEKVWVHGTAVKEGDR